MLKTDTAVATSSTVYLKDYQAPTHAFEKIALEFDLGEGKTLVTAKSQIKRLDQECQTLILDGEKMRLVSVAVNDRQLAESNYELSESQLKIKTSLNEFTLEVVTELEPEKNTELSGLYKSSGNFCTQCEAEGFRRISYFPDRPDVLSQFDVTLIADKNNYPILLSNGNLLASGESQDGRHWAHWHDPFPKPCYLFALVAGDLASISDTYKTVSGRKVELNIYTQKHNIEKCDHAMLSLKNSMRWDEEVYGREYDLEIYNIVAVDDFNMGAMENKGLNVFNSKYVLADQQSATDNDFQGIESVIGHEYFHNWSGNRVTCRDWFQLSLKEGFTVFRDQEFSADMASRAVKRIRDVQTLRTHQFKEDAGPMAHPVRPSSYQEINNFYTVTIYEKGAEVIRMMHQLVGVEGFRKATDLYFDRFDGQAVTTEDFVTCMEEANGINLTQFRHWYTQAGTPALKVEQNYSAKHNTLTLSVHQSCPATPEQTAKQPFQIPIAIALFDQNASKITEQTLVLSKESESFVFENLQSQPLVSFLRGFSAPVKVDFQRSNTDLSALVKIDDDGFARWEALQQLSMNLLLPAINDEDQTLDEHGYQELKQAFESLFDTYAANSKSDKAIFAEMLRLPPASYIAEQSQKTNPQRVMDVIELLEKALAKDLKIQILAAWSKLSTQQEFSLSAQAMANRALKNQLLRMLVHTGESQFYQLAEQHYYQANNMTDRLAAFSILVHSSYADKDTLLANFYADWQHDNLVMDKWFATQATIPEIKVLTIVHRLLGHTAFSLSNPNKVRSLIGAFTSNMRAFHRSDGAAYEFVADMVLKLNDINPQVAARLVGTFNNWRTLAAPYSDNMRAQLERIANTQGLSKDIMEIVSKALAD